MKLYYIAGDQVFTTTVAKKDLCEYEDGSISVDVKDNTYVAFRTRKEVVQWQIAELSDEICELHEEIEKIRKEQDYWRKML